MNTVLLRSVEKCNRTLRKEAGIIAADWGEHEICDIKGDDCSEGLV